jgi:DNA polymerase epsilon subunit 2
VNQPSTLAGSADSRVLAMRDRLHIIRQSVLRNEHFSPSTLPSRDRERLVTVSTQHEFNEIPAYGVSRIA